MATITKTIFSQMEKGGYLKNILACGSELDRVKQYLLAFSGEIEKVVPEHPLQRPTYPIFPELNHRAFHPIQNFEGAKILEKSFDSIKSEAEKLLSENYLNYYHRGKSNQSIHFKDNNFWTINFLYYMGVKICSDRTCPETLRIISQLPGICLDYPWADVLFSIHSSNSHLPAHCSIDNLRVRCHLGINIPDNCEIRVGEEIKQWQEGKALLFEDSIEHEVWNRSNADRLVLIVDFWHPDLTKIEREALISGFRKSEVRSLFYNDRISNTDASSSLINDLVVQFKIQDKEEIIQRYWN